MSEEIQIKNGKFGHNFLNEMMRPAVTDELVIDQNYLKQFRERRRKEEEEKLKQYEKALVKECEEESSDDEAVVAPGTAEKMDNILKAIRAGKSLKAISEEISENLKARARGATSLPSNQANGSTKSDEELSENNLDNDEKNGSGEASDFKSKAAKRAEAKARKKDKKAQKIAELRSEIGERQAIKLGEMKEKLDRIKRSGDLTELAFDENDLNKDFNEKDHDEFMERNFGDNYEDIDEDEKPMFDYDPELDDYDNYDEIEVRGGGELGGEESEEESCEAATSGNVDTEEQHGDVPSCGISRMVRRRLKKRVKNGPMKEALKKKKPIFDPATDDYDKFFDEYYGLDFEDVIANGEVVCRFKYRKVEPNNFGLTTEEIFLADDKHLNAWYDVQKMQDTNRTPEEEKNDRHVYKNKASQLLYKKKVMPSLYADDPEEEEVISTKSKKEKADKKLEKKNRNARTIRKMLEEKREAKKAITDSHPNSEDGVKKSKDKNEQDQTTNQDNVKISSMKKNKSNTGAETKVDKKEEHKKKRQEGFLLTDNSYAAVMKLSKSALESYGLTDIDKLKDFASKKLAGTFVSQKRKSEDVDQDQDNLPKKKRKYMNMGVQKTKFKLKNK